MLGRSLWWPTLHDHLISLRSSIVRAFGSRSTMASHGPDRSIPGMAAPGRAEREDSPLHEVRMDSLRSFIRPAFAAPGLVSGNPRTAARAGPTIAWSPAE